MRLHASWLPGLIGSSETAFAQSISAELDGKLVALRGKSALPYAAPDLPQTKYIALYFSAGWCGPCHQFTLQLVKFYNEMKPKCPDFEIVFMSLDQGANAMEKYMNEMAMPWPAVRYSVAKSDRAPNKYAGPAIPCLVLLNDKCEILSDSFVCRSYVGPSKVMAELKKLLSGDSSGGCAGQSRNARPDRDRANQPAKPAIKSPSGTNWDEVFKKKSP